MLRVLYLLAVVIGLAQSQTCPATSAPIHVGDEPGEGVITFGIILPLRFPGPDNQCGEANLDGLARLEAVVWSLNNARSMLGSSGLKIGAYLYDGCGTAEIAAASAADYLTKRQQGMESCDDPPQYWPGILGEFYSAASIAIAEIIKQVPVINQMTMSISDVLSEYELFTRLVPRAGRYAKANVQLSKRVVPDATAVTIVHGSDAAMRSAGEAALIETRTAGLCVTGFYEADFFSDDYTSIVDSVLEQAEKGVNVVLVFLLRTSQIRFFTEVESRIEAGDEFAKAIIILNMAVDAAELPTLKPNTISLRPFLEIPPQLESYLLDPSQPLLEPTERWAADEDCNTTTVDCRQRIVQLSERTGFLTDFSIGFEAMMNGVLTAMRDKCLISICEAFTSLSAAELSVYYRNLEFSSLKYSADFTLPFTQAFEDRERKDLYLVAWQIRNFENNSNIDIQIGDLTGDNFNLPDLLLQTFDGDTLSNPTSSCGDDCVCLNNPSAESVKRDVIPGDVRLLGLFNHRNSDCRTVNTNAMVNMEAMYWAIEQINQDNSILPGITLGTDVYGVLPCADTDGSLPDLDQIVDTAAPPVVGIIGPGYSSTTVELFTKPEHASMGSPPVISFAATSTVFNDKTKYPYFVRTVNDDTQQARAMADFISAQQWTHVMCLYSQGPYGEFGMKALAKSLASHDIYMTRTEMVRDSYLSQDNTTNLDFLISQYQKQAYEFQANTSAIVLFLEDTAITAVLDSVQRLWNLEGDSVVWIAPDFWGIQRYVINGYESTAVGAITTTFETAAIADFDTHITTLAQNDREDYPWFGEFWQDYFKCNLAGNYKYNTTCTGSLRLPVLADEQSLVPYVIDAVYAAAIGLHNHISKHCDGDTLCDKAREELPTLIDSVTAVKFGSEAGWDVEFDSLGNAPSKYDLYNLQVLGDDYQYIKVGTWNNELAMISSPVAYTQPSLAQLPLSDVRSTCEGDNCPHVEWWLYDYDYLLDNTAQNTGRITSIYVNMMNVYEGNGVCSGFNADAYMRYLAVRWIFELLENASSEKAISTLVLNPCGDAGLMERLYDTLSVITYTDELSPLNKNIMPSFVSAAGSDLSLAINDRTLQSPQIHISAISTSPYLDDVPNFVRPVPSDMEMMRVISNMVVQFSPAESHPSLLVLYDSSSQYSKGAYESLEEYVITDTPLCLSSVDIETLTDEVLGDTLLYQPISVRGALLLLPSLSVSRVLRLANAAGLAHKYFWIGTDTFPATPDPELQEISLGAIRVQPYNSDTNLYELFSTWLMSKSLQDLPDHPWSKLFWQSIFRCNLQGSDTDYSDGCPNDVTFADSGYPISRTLTFMIQSARATAHINDFIDNNYCENSNTTYQECLSAASEDPDFQNKTLEYLGSQGINALGSQDAGYRIFNMKSQTGGGQAFEEVGTAADGEITLSLSDMEFYTSSEGEIVVVSVEDAFYIDCSQGCNCTNVRSPEPRNVVDIVSGTGETRKQTTEDTKDTNTAIKRQSLSVMLYILTVMYYECFL